MRTKMAKCRNLLLACLMAVLMAGTAAVGLTAVTARAEAPVGTIEELMTYDTGYFTVSGDNATISQSSSWAYVRYPVTGYESGDISITVTPNKELFVRVLLFETGTSNWCNTDVEGWKTVAAGETYTKTFDPSKYFTDAMRTSKSFQLAFTFTNDVTAAAANGAGAEVGTEIAFSAELVEHVAPPEPEKVTIGDWESSNANLTVTENGTIEANNVTYTGLKASWNKDVGNDNRVSAPISAFDAAKTPTLHISFYTDSKIRFKVFDDNNVALLNEELKPGDPDGSYYDAGYHSFDIDMSAVQSLNGLWLYLDAWMPQALDFEGTKNVVFDYIGFGGIALGGVEDGSGDIFAVNTESGLSLTWDAKNAVNKYLYVTVPVANWQPLFQRYLVLDMTFSESAQFSFFLNDGEHLDQWGNPDEKSEFTKYVTYEKGRHVLCFDTKAILDAGMIAAGKDLKLYAFCFGGTEMVESQTNTVKFNSIEFKQTTVSPLALIVDVNYVKGTVDFDDEKLEVSANADFETLIAKGGTVQAGKLYIRSKADNTVTVEIELKNAVLTTENVPQPIITNTSISYMSAVGYEFKFGENGEWGNTKFWDNLELNTVYKVYIRKLPSETAFESNVLEVTLQLDGNYVPVSIDLDNFASRDDFIAVEKEGNKVTLSYDAADIGGNYYSVAFPVANWRQGNRYLVIDLTCTENAKLRFYLNGNKFDTWGNPVDTSAFTPDYTEYGKGRHLICLDTAPIFAANAVNAGGNNNIIIFCDGGLNTSVSLEKSITLSEVRFSQIAVDPVSLTVKVDYTAGTVDFDDEKLEVSKSANFETLLAKGGEVTPGTLYIRSKADHEMKIEITLAKAELSESTAPKALITANSISYEHVSGYEFKFGESGEWGTTALWENLNPDTEYTIYMRIPGNENNFGSDEISVKVKTKAVSGTPKPEDNKKEDKGCGCKGSVAASSVLLAVPMLFASLLLMRRRRAVK